jgi:hypothetical protein
MSEIEGWRIVWKRLRALFRRTPPQCEKCEGPLTNMGTFLLCTDAECSRSLTHSLNDIWRKPKLAGPSHTQCEAAA